MTPRTALKAAIVAAAAGLMLSFTGLVRSETNESLLLESGQIAPLEGEAAGGQGNAEPQRAPDARTRVS